MITLGLNGVDDLFHDASATIIKDGRVLASVEEERFNRKKHSNGIPFQAIEYCLKVAGVPLSDVNQIGYYLDPKVLLENHHDRMVAEYGADPQKLGYIQNVHDKILNIPGELSRHFNVFQEIMPEVHYLNHHLCHAASAFYPSGYKNAAILVVDGAGDRESISLYRGAGKEIHKVWDFMIYPQSLGFIYTLFSGHLGLGWIEGPGKLMGLAAYGRNRPELVEGLISFHDDPYQPLTMHVEKFAYHLGDGDIPDDLVGRFGPQRERSEELTQFHMDVAASIQTLISDAIMHVFRQVPKILPDEDNFCYAGGLALNVLTNRRMIDAGLFDQVFITPAAYDGGCSLGAALYLNALYDDVKADKEFVPYLGPDIENDYDIETAVSRYSDVISGQKLTDEQLITAAAQDLARSDRQMIIGWMQGRMEVGPRALGNRSILTSPISSQAKAELDNRVKRREGFRPYAPSVLEDMAEEWFDLKKSPYMLLEAKVHEDRKKSVPAIVHVDGSARPQTVHPDMNEKYYRLISAFYELTNVPVVLNTSLNRHGEPIVNTPDEAIRVLLETGIDAIYVGRWRIIRKEG